MPVMLSLYSQTDALLETAWHTVDDRVDTVHHGNIKWKYFLLYWSFVRGIHRSPVNSLHKGQWCGALMFPLICTWIYGWVYNRKAGDLRRHRTHYDVIVMTSRIVNMVHTLWCLLWSPTCWFYSYPSWLLHRHRGNHLIPPVPVN